MAYSKRPSVRRMIKKPKPGFGGLKSPSGSKVRMPKVGSRKRAPGKKTGGSVARFPSASGPSFGKLPNAGSRAVKAPKLSDKPKVTTTRKKTVATSRRKPASPGYLTNSRKRKK